MNCLFCKIINGEIPSKKAFENENIYAFYDIAPQAPVHILVIPKKHIASVDEISAENSAIVAEIFENIPKIAKEAGIPPSQLGLNPQNIAGLRKALGSATTEDIQKMGCIYEEYRRQRHQK